MQVQGINTHNNQALTPTLGVNVNQRARVKDVSFSGIFKPRNINFNKVQESIGDTISTAMREPLQKFKGETAEGFYKSKGLDFLITPRSRKSISLSAYRGLKEIGVGVDRRYTCSDSLYIGEYDKNSEFRMSDIEKRIKEKNKSDLGFIAVAITAITSFILIATLGGAMKSGSSKHKIQETTKPLIENVNNATNKVKGVK